MTIAPASIVTVPVGGDNYAYLIVEGDMCSVVDPAEPGPIITEVVSRRLTLSTILITHHHGDHCGGVRELRKRFRCEVLGPADERVPDLEQGFSDGNSIGFVSSWMKVLHVPGHTRSHVAYLLDDPQAVFTGDTLFCAGCGRVMEGTAQQMWSSLQRLAALPPETLVYPGHEYTEENLRFALAIEPANAAVKARYAAVKAAIGAGRPSVPSTVGEERATNPFLRSADPAMKSALGMTTAGDAEVFAELRRRKDRF